MAIKVNARETELKFGKEATYHSAMIWKMKQIAAFCGIRRAHRFRGLHRFEASARLLGASIAAQEIIQIK